ncbi:hypothetical protein [Leuconostoc suionicum]|uniref:hypothetical protein n=1 Tax=Leuconostoc suionicum TaxID=1511761 RepID=UPI00233E5EFA|nr:hypothetical protein [Leuconostoc suionicum]MDC2822683.1 hypothetical protein [Leuconostoc suionicum]
MANSEPLKECKENSLGQQRNLLLRCYRDLDLLIKETDRNTESGLNKIEEQLYQAKRQLREKNL